ncbi:MAG: hypothetical protein Tsb0016_12150 [Sphingomonadales bacterium]
MTLAERQNATPPLTEVMRANIEVHSRLVEDYDKEPHFRPENRAKVRAVLEQLQIDTQGKRLLDLGCGTGFIINLAHDLFDDIHGVDLTPAMLAKIDTSPGNITLHNIPAEALPFPDASFDVVTAYAFLHHLEDYATVLAEAFRVLRPGGKLYVDLDPNRGFWHAIADAERQGDTRSAIVAREIGAALHVDEAVAAQFGIAERVINLAEYTKSILGGIDAEEFAGHCRHIGFATCETRYQWFLGQGSVMHGRSFELADEIESYLNDTLPLSAHLFKYLRFIVTK